MKHSINTMELALILLWIFTTTFALMLMVCFTNIIK